MEKLFLINALLFAFDQHSEKSHSRKEQPATAILKLEFRMAGLLVVGIPFLIVCLVVASFSVWSTVRNRRNQQLAAARGITYRRFGNTPIAVPKVVYGQRDLTEMSSFLYGPWQGLDCFACNFKIGWGRGSVVWLSMVAIHAQLNEVSGLDMKLWELTPFNGWTFLIPKQPKGGMLKVNRVKALWDVLAAAVLSVDSDQLNPPR